MGQGLEVVCKVLFRVLIPAVLLAATIFRINFLSLVYGCLLLVSPLLPCPSAASMKSHTARYLRALTSISLLFIVGRAIFQGVLLLMKPIADIEYYDLLPDCTTSAAIARQFGFQRLNASPTEALSVVRLVVPDVVVFFTAIISYLVCRKLITSRQSNSLENPSTGPETRTLATRLRLHEIIEELGQFFVFVTLGLSGIMSPSVLSAVYFLTFMFSATWWSCYKSFSSFIYCKVLLLLYSAFHVVIIYLYQFEFFQEQVPPESFYARLFGLTGLVTPNCTLPLQMTFTTSSFVYWTEFVSPGVILLFYYCAALQFQHWMSIPKAEREEHALRAVSPKKSRRKNVPEERQTLIDARTPSASYNTIEQQDEPTAEVDGEDGADDKTGERSVIMSILMFTINQSYLVTLIFMMAWSIVYHSWLSFVLLLAACIIWMIPNAGRACLVCSPVIVLYAEALVIIQYVYGFKLTADELSESVLLTEIGLQKTKVAFVPLLVKMMMFTGMFWLTLYQLTRSRHRNQQMSFMVHRRGSRLTHDHGEGFDSKEVRMAGLMVQKFLSKYWIFVCAALFLFMAVQEAVLYRIIYMVLFLFFVQIFQFSYRFWRFILYGFWWFVIVYSMIVLLLIYTYQFETFQQFWNRTNLNETSIKDIGLEMYDPQQLALKLLTPTVFLIIVIIQLHIVHQPFLKISDIDRYKGTEQRVRQTGSSSEEERETSLTEEVKKSKFFSKKTWSKLNDVHKSVCEFLWRLLEVHIFKLVVFTIVIVSLVNVSAVSGVLVVIVAVLLPVPKLHGLLSVICHFCTGLVILMKMAFQLNTVTISPWIRTCNFTGWSSFLPNITEVNDAPWMGLDKLNGKSLGDYVVGYIFIILILSVETVVKLRQTQRYNDPNEKRPLSGIIFKDIRREDADEGIVAFGKFLFNYAFYKFGVEVCFTMSIIVASVRMDAYSIVYVILLGIGMLCWRVSRRCLSIWWPAYVILLAVLLPVQYVLALGAPPGFCWVYPWRVSMFPAQLQQWMFLPPQEGSLPAMKLLADFFQLLFACQLWTVFRLENSAKMAAYGGGSNQPVMPKDVREYTDIPGEDFIAEKRTYLDVLKAAVFQYFFWVTFIIVFLTGTSKQSMFCFGYLLTSFYLFWFGEDLLTKSQRKLLRVWSIIQAYNLFVIFAKACLQVVACVFIKDLIQSPNNEGCILIQLFNIVCLQDPSVISNNLCSVQPSGVGLSWDCVCFTFLMIQRRLFQTHYFRYVVLEVKAQQALASRGAQLINRIMVRQVAAKKLAEEEELSKIKKKMEKIKLRQARLHQQAVVEDESDHYKIIRSGGAYMFEDDSDEEESVSVFERMDRHVESPDSDKPMGPIQLLNAVMEGGTKKALLEHQARSGTSVPSTQGTTSPTSPFTPTTPKVEGDSDVAGVSPADGQLVFDDSTRVGERDLEEVEIKDSDGVEESQEVEIQKAGCCERITDFFRLVWAIICSLVDSGIRLMNKISQDYRLVAKILDTDKANVKQGLIVQTAAPGANDVDRQELADSAPRTEMTDVSININESGNDDSDDQVDRPSLLPLPRISSLEAIAVQIDKPDLERSRLYRFFKAVYYALVSHTELLCYFAMIINQMFYACLLSLPLAIMVFFWGMLSVPRPAKAFWVAVITYTEIIVVIKYFFQFEFWQDINLSVSDGPANSGKNVLKLIGLEINYKYAMMDLVVLVLVFLHRSLLKRHGLWKDADEIENDITVASKMESRPSSPILDKDFAVDSTDSQLSLGADAHSERQKMVVEADDSAGQDGNSNVEKQATKRAKVRDWTSPFKTFYRQLTREDYNTTTDVYAYMFFCDFINFFIVVFGYWGFGPAEDQFGDFRRYVAENRIPVPFLIVLVLQFALIIIDRALYLKKNVTGKFIFHIAVIIIVHVWVFFILPIVTGREFADSTPVIIWYFIKCIYLALSATQIRCGYPTRVLGNFLTNNFNYLNLVLFKGFLVIPFLLELRALMDWMWTDTTLALSSWLQMEDIFSNVYVLKCWRWSEHKYPTPRGQPRRAIVKYGFGGLVLFLVVFIIWFPLLLFSFANAVYEPNLPIECSVDISVAGYQPLFTRVTMAGDITTYTTKQYQDLQNEVTSLSTPADVARAKSFLSTYEARDTVLIRMNGNSTAVWGISPPAELQLKLDMADSNKRMQFLVDLSFTRKQEPGLTQTTTRVQLSVDINEERRKIFFDLLNRTSKDSVNITDLIPQFIQIPVSNVPVNASNQLRIERDQSITLNLKQQQGLEWWEIRTDESIPSFEFTAFSDRIAPGALVFLAGYGIIGLYVSLVFVVGRFVRTITMGQHAYVMFEELPCVDRIFSLCRKIYFVRENREFQLEEDLYAKLVYLYRSPQMLIKWTCAKEKQE